MLVMRERIYAHPVYKELCVKLVIYWKCQRMCQEPLVMGSRSCVQREI